MKRIITLCTVLTLCFSAVFSSVAFADEMDTGYPISITGESTADSNSTVQPKAEETRWYYREYNGNIEKRLWSITYGKWLTDWIYVCPAP